jgi:hypothetical protein
MYLQLGIWGGCLVILGAMSMTGYAYAAQFHPNFISQWKTG